MEKVAPAAAMHKTPELEALFLKHKHLGLPLNQLIDVDAFHGQKPLGGAEQPMRGGSRKHAAAHKEQSDDDVWAMMMPHHDAEHARMLKGGHGVPLSGKLSLLITIVTYLRERSGADPSRLRQRAVLCSHHGRNSSPGLQGHP